MKVEFIVANDLEALEEKVNQFIAQHTVVDIQYLPVAIPKTARDVTITQISNRVMITYYEESENERQRT